MSSKAHWKGEVLKAIAANDSEALRRLLLDNATYCNEYSERLYSGDAELEELAALLDLLTSGVFTLVTDSAIAFQIIRADWAAFTEPQVQMIVRHIGQRYGDYKDFMACFVMTEILGECSADRSALDTVLVLRDTIGDEQHRSLLPHALEHISVEAKSASVRNLARRELEAGKFDRCPKYRSEVQISLWRLTPEDQRDPDLD